MTQTSHYASLPTYIPPVNFASEFPAYMPTTSVISRSRSGRVVYDDDPWNSAKTQNAFAADTRDAFSLHRRPKGPRQRPMSWINQAKQSVLNAGPSKCREQPATSDPRRGSRSGQPLPMSATRQRPVSMLAAAPLVHDTARASASPFNIPYSMIGSLHINTPTTQRNSLSNQFPLPEQRRQVSRSRSPPSIRTTRHPAILVPGGDISSSQRRTPSPEAIRQLQRLSFTGPSRSPSFPAPATPSVLSPLMPSRVWMSPSGSTNPMTASSSRSGSMDVILEDVTRCATSRTPVGRKVSDSTEEAPLSPVHSLSITEVEYMLLDQSVNVVHREPEPVDALESPIEDPGLWRQWDQAGSGRSDTELTVAALRRQLHDDEQDESEWISITDMLLARVTSRATTLASHYST